jgi:hypothetical protein
MLVLRALVGVILRVSVGADVITWIECTFSWLRFRYFEIVMAANDVIDTALPSLGPAEVANIPLLTFRPTGTDMRQIFR